MARLPRDLLLRLLRRILAKGRGEARALEQAMHLRGVLRFVGVFAATILLPGLLLAYFGITSIQSQELEVLGGVQHEADAVATAFSQDTERAFSGFERGVRNRLEAGRSPLESPKELHRNLLVAFRFSEEGELLAPFQRPSSGPLPQSDLTEPSLMAAVASERAGLDPIAVARLYNQAARSAQHPGVIARARFDRARMLAKAGRDSEALSALAQLSLSSGGLRDPWGLRLRDLARLEASEILLAQDAENGRGALKGLIDDILARRWEIGDGSDAAVARRALSLMQPFGSKEWANQVRDRVAERTELLYWATQLLPELDEVVGHSGRVRTGTFSWRLGERGAWALTWWDGDLYAFGLDREALESALKADARGVVLPDANVAAFIVKPGESAPEDWMERRSLSPWLAGYDLVVVAKDLDALMKVENRQRSLRIVMVATAVFTIVVGVMLSAILVKRELDMAGMKTDFAANVSHELRSPITQIRLKGESLMLGLADTEEELEAHYIAIVRESERLSRLVDNVLDFAAIERGAKSYTLRPGDIVDTVYRAIDSIASAQELANKELDIQLPHDMPEVRHDADAFAQCVINLVSNAAKYSGDGGRIVITARLVDDPKLGRCVEVAVSDDGIGIPPHDLRRIFDPFFRSNDSLARRRKGTGIGLAITKYIIDSHGGQIGVQSRPGRGSTFTLRLPVAPPEDASSGIFWGEATSPNPTGA